MRASLQIDFTYHIIGMDDKKPSDENKAGAPLKKDKDGKPLPKEYGGVKGPEPTRYGDWTNGGRTTDF